MHALLFGAETPGNVQPEGATEALTLLAHIQNMGDTPSSHGGWVGAAGSGLAIEGFEILPVPGLPADCLTYEAIFADGTSSPRVPMGVFCGTRGEGRQLAGFCLHIGDDWNGRIWVFADAQFTDATETRNAPAGLACAATTNAALEGLRIRMVKQPQK